MTSSSRPRNGFTILEAVVVIFISALVGMAIAVFQRDIIRLNDTLSYALTGQQEARRAQRVMLQEIRAAETSNGGAYPISEAGTDQFIFYSDPDGDGTRERYRYFLSGTTLRKGVIVPSGTPMTYNPANEQVATIVRGMANGSAPLFEYYDETYSGTGTALALPVSIPDVRLIKITMVIDHVPTRPPGPATSTLQIAIRNLKDNL